MGDTDMNLIRTPNLNFQSTFRCVTSSGETLNGNFIGIGSRWFRDVIKTSPFSTCATFTPETATSVYNITSFVPHMGMYRVHWRHTLTSRDAPIPSVLDVSLGGTLVSTGIVPITASFSTVITEPVQRPSTAQNIITFVYSLDSATRNCYIIIRYIAFLRVVAPLFVRFALNQTGMTVIGSTFAALPTIWKSSVTDGKTADVASITTGDRAGQVLLGLAAPNGSSSCYVMEWDVTQMVVQQFSNWTCSSDSGTISSMIRYRGQLLSARLGAVDQLALDTRQFLYSFGISQHMNMSPAIAPVGNFIASSDDQNGGYIWLLPRMPVSTTSGIAQQSFV
jgi:hypothetical protein